MAAPVTDFVDNTSPRVMIQSAAPTTSDAADIGDSWIVQEDGAWNWYVLTASDGTTYTWTLTE